MKLEIDPSLKDRLYDLYFRQACGQEGWSYVRPDEILAGKSRLLEGNTISFHNGTGTVDVTIMKQLIPEITRLCQPEQTFDYLACRTGTAQAKTIVANPEGLYWILIKRGNSIFSERQTQALAGIRLSLAVFRIRDILAAPRSLEFRLDIRSGTEWLDLLDELKDQEEYDDEFF